MVEEFRNKIQEDQHLFTWIMKDESRYRFQFLIFQTKFLMIFFLSSQSFENTHTEQSCVS